MTRSRSLALALVWALVSALVVSVGLGPVVHAQETDDATALQQRIIDLKAERDVLDAEDTRRRVVQSEIDVVERRMQLLADERALPTKPTQADVRQAEAARDQALASAEPEAIAARAAGWRDITDPEVLKARMTADLEAPLREARAAETDARRARQDALLRRDAALAATTAEEVAVADAAARLAGLREQQSAAGLSGDARLLVERRLRIADEEVSYHEQRRGYLRRLTETVAALATLAEIEYATARARLQSLEASAEVASQQLTARLEEAAASAETFERIFYREELAVLAFAKAVATSRGPVDAIAAKLASVDRQLADVHERRRQHALIYSGKSTEPTPPQRQVRAMLADLRAVMIADREAAAARRRERQTAAEAVAAGRQRADALRARVSQARAAARTAFDALQPAGTDARAAWAQGPESRWQDLDRRVAQLSESYAEQLDSTVRLLDRVIEKRQELAAALAETVALLHRENLFLRGESAITAESVEGGLDDLGRLPRYLLDALGKSYEHLRTPGNRGPSTLLLALLAVVLVLLLRRRLTRVERAREEPGTLSPQARAGLHVARALCVGTAVFLVPFLAATLLVNLAAPVAEWLRLVSFVLGGSSALWLISGILFPREAASPFFRCYPQTATLLRSGLRLLLILTVVLVPLERALTLLGYENAGAIELVWAVYNFGVVIALLLFVLRRAVLLDMLPAPTTNVGRLARFWLSALHPVVLLIGPAVLLLDLLDFDMLAGFITRLAVGVAGAVLVGHLAYRVLWGVVEAWLRSVLASAEPPAESEEPAPPAGAAQPAASPAPTQRDPASASSRRVEPGGEGEPEESPPALSESVASVARFTLACIVAAVAATMLLRLQGATLEDVRAFLEVPLPFQTETTDPTTLVTWWSIVSGIVVFGVFVVLNRYVKVALEGFVLPRSLDHGVRYTVSTLVGYVFVGLGVYLGLRQVFVLANLAWIVAALSLGIGFGLQEIISNFVSGLILLFERPLKVGDMVKVGEVEGFVERINIRSTAITTLENVTLLIPNKDFITQAVVNYVHGDDVVRFTIPVGVAYGSDTSLVRRILLRAAHAHPRVLHRPRPDALFKDFGESSLDFALRVWINSPKDHRTVESELRLAIDAAFREHGVEIPFPQRDLHLRSVDSDAVVRTGPPLESGTEQEEDDGSGA